MKRIQMKKMSRSEAGKLGWEKVKDIQLQHYKQRIDSYNANPKLCVHCDKIIDYSKRRNKFCSHSCSSSHNNLGIRRHGNNRKKACSNCGKITKNFKYCSHKCQHQYAWKLVKQTINNTGIAQFDRKGTLAKRYLLEIRGHKCELCNLTEWRGELIPIPIILDHINGHSDDWRISNLRLICPNCDAQTPTYKIKNKGNGRDYRRKGYHVG